MSNTVQNNDASGQENPVDMKGATLKEVMEKKLSENNTQAQESTLKELEQTPDFKAAPQEVKDKIRQAGGIVDDELDDLAKTVKRNREEISTAVEQKTGKVLTAEDFKNAKNGISPTETSSIEDDIELDFQKHMAEIAGDPDSAEDESDDMLQEKQLRQFDKALEESSIVSFIDNGKTIPSDSAALSFKVKRNTEFEENLKTILDANNIKYKTSKKGSLKTALLRSFISRLPHVTTPLINSGFHITLSGASVPEIIQMNTIAKKSKSDLEITKLGFICKHIVDSSMGSQMNVAQLSKAVFYKDLQTLYFNQYIGSFPGDNEYPITCETPSCRHNMKLHIKSSDMVLNAHEFGPESNYILYQSTDISDILSYSKVSKEKRVLLKNKLVVVFRNPTIYDITFLSKRLEDQNLKNLSSYVNVVGYLTFIKSIALPDDSGEYIIFDEIQDLLEILTALDSESQDELDEQIKEYTEVNVVKYGLPSYKCPKCGRVYPAKEMDMSDFLFLMSQFKYSMTRLAKLKEKDKNSSVSSSRPIGE